MNLIRFSFLTIVFICFSSIGLIGQGYRLDVEISDLPGKELILSHRVGFKFYTDDTIKTDVFGRGVFEGKDLMPAGMYQLVFPDKKYAEFFLDKAQIFNISTRVSAPADSLKFTNSPDNARFLDWQKKYTFSRVRSNQIQNLLKDKNLSTDSVNLLTKEFQQIQRLGDGLWDTAIKDLAGTLPGNFIKGLKPVKIPESLSKLNTKEGQMKQYQYMRQHFFDEINFENENLLRTPLIESKLDQYFKQIVPPMPDTIIQDANKIIEKAKPSKNMYQFVVQFLFNLYSNPEIMGTDAVYVYLADNYYLTKLTPWIDSINLQGIQNRVNELKPLLIGKVAPPMDGLLTPDDKPVDLKSIKSKFLILYFWSPDCSFCKESTPKLHSQYAELKQLGVEIVAIDTRIDKELWLKFIAEKQLTWINVQSPVKSRENIEKYQAFTTPTLFILDRDRRIIAKSISVEQVTPFLKQYISGQ